MSTGVVIFWGILSAYSLNPTVGTLEYHQALGQLPADLTPYAVYLAVDDCSLIGHEARLITGDEIFQGIIFDCASAYGAQFFSDGDDQETPFKLAADADYWFWKTHPDIVHSLVLVEVER
jgi:hypothetical protein